MPPEFTDAQCMAMFVAAITLDDALHAEFKTGSAAAAMATFNERYPKFKLSEKARKLLADDRATVRLTQIRGDIVQATNAVGFV